MAAKLETGAVGTGEVLRLCVGPAAAAARGPLVSYPRRVPARRIQLVAAVVGAASLGAEIAAARLLAPWFGASTVIWANTIATVLVALSAGYWVRGGPRDRVPALPGLPKGVLRAAPHPPHDPRGARAVLRRSGRAPGA